MYTHINKNSVTVLVPYILYYIIKFTPAICFKLTYDLLLTVDRLYNFKVGWGLDVRSSALLLSSSASAIDYTIRLWQGSKIKYKSSNQNRCENFRAPDLITILTYIYLAVQKE